MSTGLRRQPVSKARSSIAQHSGVHCSHIRCDALTCHFISLAFVVNALPRGSGSVDKAPDSQWTNASSNPKGAHFWYYLHRRFEWARRSQLTLHCLPCAARQRVLLRALSKGLQKAEGRCRTEGTLRAPRGAIYCSWRDYERHLIERWAAEEWRSGGEEGAPGARVNASGSGLCCMCARNRTLE